MFRSGLPSSGLTFFYHKITNTALPVRIPYRFLIPAFTIPNNSTYL